MLRVRLLVRPSRSAADACLATLGLVTLRLSRPLGHSDTSFLVPAGAAVGQASPPVRPGCWAASPTYLAGGAPAAACVAWDEVAAQGERLERSRHKDHPAVLGERGACRRVVPGEQAAREHQIKATETRKYQA